MLVDLQRFEIKDSVLFIEGVGIIEGVDVVSWSDIHYVLIFDDGVQTYEKRLAKDHKPEMTSNFAKHGERYDKCYFATTSYKGVDISDIPLGQYRLKLKIITPHRTEVAYLSSLKQICIDNEQFSLDTGGAGCFGKFVLKSYQSTIAISDYTAHQLSIVGGYLDDRGNSVIAPANLTNCFVKFGGCNNRVVIHHKANLNNVTLDLPVDNALVEIGENVRMTGNWRIGHGCTLKIGKNSSSTNPVYMTCAEGSSIIIGEDCMFATNNQIRTDDAHPIYDVNTGQRINLSRDVILGSHVWIGYGATLLGGATVGDGSVIGAYALVNKSHSNNCLLVGTPAKTVKHDIFWERAPLLVTSKEPKHYTQEELSQKSYCNNTIVD